MSFLKSKDASCALRQNDVKDTPLHIACRHSCVEVVMELLSERAAVGLRNKNQDMPLHLSVPRVHSKQYEFHHETHAMLLQCRVQRL